MAYLPYMADAADMALRTRLDRDGRIVLPVKELLRARKAEFWRD